MNHTPEPWSIEQHSPAGLCRIVRHSGATTHIAEVVVKANARRIVACVNALAGIPTEALETMRMVSLPRELVEQRDKLAADNATLCAALTTTSEGNARLIEQRDCLHSIVCQCLDALDNGSGASNECSIAFLSDAPAEIGAVVADFRRQRDELLVACRRGVLALAAAAELRPEFQKDYETLSAAITNVTNERKEG